MGHMTPKTTKRWSIIFWPILIAVAVLSAYLLWGHKVDSEHSSPQLKAIKKDNKFAPQIKILEEKRNKKDFKLVDG